MKNKLIKFGLLLIVIPPLMSGFPYSPNIDSMMDIANSCNVGTSTMRGAYLTMTNQCLKADVSLSILRVVFVVGIVMILVKIIHKVSTPLKRLLKDF